MAAESETRDQRAERLAPVAVEWSERLRSEDVDTLAVEVLDPLPRPDLYALIGLLGGAADTSVHPDLWWGWVRYREAIEAAAPIVWDDDEVPIEAMDSRQINGLIERLTGRGRTARQIAEETGLSIAAVAKRLERLRRPASVGACHLRVPQSVRQEQ